MFEPDFMQATDGEWVHFAPGKSRRVRLHIAELMQVEARLSSGVSTPEHSHPHAQVSFVLAGRMRVTVGGHSTELSEGGSFIVPPGIVHSGLALTDVVLLDTFTPARGEFLLLTQGEPSGR
jgi:quercetin dioxygenase-like cupin family protein